MNLNLLEAALILVGIRPWYIGLHSLLMRKTHLLCAPILIMEVTGYALMSVLFVSINEQILYIITMSHVGVLLLDLCILYHLNNVVDDIETSV